MDTQTRSFANYEQWRLPLKKRTVPLYIMRLANGITPNSTPGATPEFTPNNTPQDIDINSPGSSSSTSPPLTGIKANLRSHNKKVSCPCHDGPCMASEPKKRKRSVGKKPASTVNKKKKTERKTSK